jgi:Cu+-exporting ATPase
VEEALRSVPGVISASVNLATERATVNYNPDGTGLAELVKAVRDAGYDVPVEKMTLPIVGMTCASCVAHVEKAIGTVEGVLNVSVNLATERATVEYIPGVASFAEIVAAVKKRATMSSLNGRSWSEKGRAKKSGGCTSPAEGFFWRGGLLSP